MALKVLLVFLAIYVDAALSFGRWGHWGTCAPCYRIMSCKDVYYMSIWKRQSVSSGEYYLENGKCGHYRVYCEFNLAQRTIYTFVAPTDLDYINIDDLYNNQHQFLIRYQEPDGSQRESVIRQLSSLEGTTMSFQYNTNINHNDIVNTQMGPYMYLGLLPKLSIRRHDTNGYNVNGDDETFRNCDGNQNLYFTLLFNANDESPIVRKSVSNYIRQWITKSDPASNDLPDRYFSLAEIHHGGCGGLDRVDLMPTVTGMTFGLLTELPDDDY